MCEKRISDNSKVAVLVSGEPRGSRECGRQLKENLIDGLRGDLFGFLWGSSARNGMGTKGGHWLSETRTPIGFERGFLSELGSPTSIQVSAFQTEYFNRILSVVRPKNLKLLEPVHSRGLLPMTYSAYKGLQLIKQHEELTGRTYQYIVKVRPDLLIEERVTREILCTGCLIASDHMLDPQKQLSDKLIMGPRDHMVEILGVFERLDDILAQWNLTSDWGSRPVGERLYRQIADQSRMPVRFESLKVRLERELFQG